MAFGDIPDRSNGETILANWFNKIKEELTTAFGSTADDSSLFDVVSTTKGSRPFPSMTEAQRDAISSPANGLVIYNTDNDKLNLYNGSSWGEVAGGVGGGFNLETDPYAQLSEDGSTGSWIGYDDAAADAVDLTGGTFDTTFANENSDTTILSGDYAGNFLWTLDAADRQGEGIAKTYTIPPALRGKAVYVSGRYTTDVATSNGDFGVYVYDVINTELTNIYGLTDNNLGGLSAGGIGKFSFVFYTANDTASVRIGFHRKVTDATATEFRFSDLKVSDVPLVDVPIVGEYEFTPTGTLTTNVTYSGYYDRKGSKADIYYSLVFTGVNTQGGIQINMPPGLTLDESRIFGSDDLSYFGGEVIFTDTAPGSYFIGKALYSRSGNNFILAVNNDNLGGTNNFIPVSGASTSTNVPFTFASGDEITVKLYDIPIAEWSGSSSGGVISTRGLMNENPVAIYTGNGGEALTANTTNIAFSTKEKDTHNAWDGDEFTAPSTGYYSFNGAVTLTANVAQDISSYINGAERRVAGTEITGDNVHMFNGFRYLQKGQKLSIRASANATLSNSAIFHVINIKKDPDLTVLAPYGEYEVLSAESSVWTGTGTNSADIYGQLTGNKLTLSPGTWKLTGSGVFSNSGGAPGYAAAFLRWTTANGANTVTNPGLFSFDHGRDGGSSGGNHLSGGTYFELLASNGIVTVTSQTDIYLVPIVNASTLSNARVTTFLEAQRLR